MAKQQVDHGLSGLIYLILGPRDEKTGVVPLIAQGKILRPMGSNLHLVRFINPSHMRMIENDSLVNGVLFQDGKELEDFLAAIQPPTPAGPTDPVDNPALPDGTDESADYAGDATEPGVTSD